MIWIDEEKVFSEIKKNKPKVVAINAPEGLMMKVHELTFKIQELFGVQTITIADPCYGICDTVDEEAERLGADIAFHIGHNVAIERIGKNTVSIDAIDDVDFDEVLKASLPTLKRYGVIGLCTIAQHIHKIQKVESLLKEKGIRVIIGKGKGLIKDGQILGCDFHTVFEIREDVNAFIFLGQSIFHAIGVALATSKPTFMLDPYYKEALDVTPIASDVLKKAILSIYKALDANTIGIIIGLKEGQKRLDRAWKIKDELEKHSKKVSFIALHEINNERLIQLQKIDAFIQTACPRISINGESFDRPVLSALQAEALIRILDGKDFEDVFQRSIWF
ncbi:MAG: diphthamide biosynthesis enzyme Dph2 [archaeon]|nr:diphthamide biosynthesis enzyme Dph2 [archaeon]MCP8313268.1 diphthamide biosynthesis enzyme Dph2 [archaeon]MCP8319473.1 diphthamide biosynthesis enzyme Dph2 [archaeon]